MNKLILVDDNGKKTELESYFLCVVEKDGSITERIIDIKLNDLCYCHLSPSDYFFLQFLNILPFNFIFKATG